MAKSTKKENSELYFWPIYTIKANQSPSIIRKINAILKTSGPKTGQEEALS